MKVAEILRLSKEMLELLQKSGIKVNHVQYLRMYEEYVEHLKSHEKKSYIVLCLAKKYSISERKVYYLIKTFEKDCKIYALK